MDGYGVAYEQSLPAGSNVNEYSDVTVKFKNIESSVDTSIKEVIPEADE